MDGAASEGYVALLRGRSCHSAVGPFGHDRQYPVRVSWEADGPAVRPALLLFTESYPYESAREDTFLEPQLAHLLRSFDRVIIVPSRRGGPTYPIPSNVVVDEGLAALLDGTSRLRFVREALGTRLFWSDIARKPSLLRSSSSIKRLARRSALAMLTSRWLVKALQRLNKRPAEVLTYSFWCDHTATGVCVAKRWLPGLMAVARINGRDFVEERYDPAYLPCQRFTLANLDYLYAVSDYGLQYVRSRYPEVRQHSGVSKLGVVDTGVASFGSPVGQFTVVSCSAIVPVKRVSLILAGLAEAARRRPETRFTWHHFGAGQTDELRTLAASALPPNTETNLHDHKPVAEIMQFYRSNAVDAFVNVSASEGGVPVAMMEAASVGLPLIATRVGGSPEIATGENGVVISADPAPAEVATAFLTVLDRNTDAPAMRKASRTVWAAQFDAATNYPRFARQLLNLRRSARADHVA